MHCSFHNQLKIDAFQSKTTYLNDYQTPCITKAVTPVKHPAKDEVFEKIPPKQSYESHETFAKLKDDIYIPFNLLWQPKPILETHPQKKLIELEPIEVDNEEIIKSRPKVYLPSACDMDDISDKNIRKMLCDYTYTTQWRKAEKEGASNFQRQIPSIQETTTKDTVSLNVDLYKPIDSKFKKKSKEWDDQQARAYSDTTKSFWAKNPPFKACEEDVLDDITKSQISNAIRNRRLRLAYDLPLSSYAGYTPRIAKGVSLEQKPIPITHPMLSVSQAIALRFVNE